MNIDKLNGLKSSFAYGYIKCTHGVSDIILIDNDLSVDNLGRIFFDKQRSAVNTVISVYFDIVIFFQKCVNGCRIIIIRVAVAGDGCKITNIFVGQLREPDALVFVKLTGFDIVGIPAYFNAFNTVYHSRLRDIAGGHKRQLSGRVAICSLRIFISDHRNNKRFVGTFDLEKRT